MPDLRRSGALGDRDSWNQIVIQGALSANGMASFKRWLTSEDAEAIRAYVASDARALKSEGHEMPVPRPLAQSRNKGQRY